MYLISLERGYCLFMINHFFKKAIKTKESLEGAVSGKEAYTDTLSNKYSKWPARGAKCRIEPRCEPDLNPKHTIQLSDQIFTIGSCFARSIELALKKHGYQIPSADVSFPSGELWPGTKLASGLLNKYTPQSILNELEYVFNDTYTEEDFLIKVDEGKYLDLQLHSTQVVSLQRGIERRKEIKESIKGFVTNADVIVVTLGLIEVWWDSHNNVYLNEAPPKKLVDKYKNRFTFEVMSPEGVFESVSKLIKMFKKYSKNNAWILLTVSPIPLARTFRKKDVILANMYSKSLLRVAAEVEATKSDFVEYFPSYESIMLSDRINTWQDDLIHLQPPAVERVIERFIKEYGNTKV